MLTGLDALVVGAGLKTGLDIVLDDPGTIAADLVATAVAAKELYPLPAFIVDMGTATKITVVDAKGRYIGGTIGPGVGISLGCARQ
jgi:type III pantothenate kinase